MTPETGFQTTTLATAEHLLIAPILIPLFAGTLMLFYNDRRRWLKLGIGLASVCALFLVSVQLMGRMHGEGEMRLYLLGNWPMPMGILLVLDRLSAMMVLLTALLALPTLLYTAAGWQGKGQHYHSLFQFLLMGLNGAFLTGDVFNLFVFFEVMLAASYALVLHGGGPDRIKAGLLYIAINLAASLLFLIGAALIYGVAGTLNMAEISRLLSDLRMEQRPLFLTGTGILGLAFLVKAAIWPVCFWLPRTYATAAPPAAAMMAIMSKVGVYAILRLAMLFFAPGSGGVEGFGGPVLAILGIATMVFGVMGVLAVPGLALKAGHIALISSGTVIAITGLALIGGGERMLAGALYYLMGSTAAVAALYLLAEPLSRAAPQDDTAADTRSDPEEPPLDWGPMGMGAVEDDDAPVTTLPASTLALAVSFMLLVGFLAGVPPFAGFIGKFAMISGMLADTADAAGGNPAIVWTFIAVLLASSLAVLIALLRFGIARFWVAPGDRIPVLALETAPVILLLVMLVDLTVQGNAAMRYTQIAARDLLAPPAYAEPVLTVEPLAEPAAGTGAEWLETYPSRDEPGHASPEAGP